MKLFWSTNNIRPIGLQFGFVPFGTICFYCFVLLIENKIVHLSNGVRISLIILFATTILMSSYYSALMGFVLFLIYKSIYKLFEFNKKICCNAMILFFMAVFLFLFITTNTYDVYNFVISNIPSLKDKAYTSIFIRADVHQLLLNGLDIKQALFGVGFGINGVMGLDTSLLTSNIGVIATDSTYSYLISNYGVIITLIWIAFMIYFLSYVAKKDKIGITFIVIYTLVIEFFFNNSITNFPVNYILIMLILLALRIEKDNTCTS